MERGELHPELGDVEKLRLLRLGVTLFDQGSYFDAHEPWEAIWRSRNPEPRELFQGLVQVAAGFHHWFARGRAGPAARLLERGARRLEPFEHGGQLAASMVIDLARFRAQVGAWIDWLALREGVAPSPPTLGGGTQGPPARVRRTDG